MTTENPREPVPEPYGDPARWTDIDTLMAFDVEGRPVAREGLENAGFEAEFAAVADAWALFLEEDDDSALIALGILRET